MFKKRAINKEPNNLLSNEGTNQSKGIVQNRPVNTGIDLRKDIQEMQQIISIKKDHNAHYPQDDHDQEKDMEKQESSVFKTKRINKFTSHILKNLPTRTLEKQVHPSSFLPNQKDTQSLHPLTKPSQLAQSFHTQSQNNNDIFRPNLNNYGLLDKSQFSSGSNKNDELIEAGKGKNHQQALMDYYIKKRMEQMTKPINPTPSHSFGSGNPQAQRQPEAWQEVLQIQKQYLTQEQKIKEYSMQEIQKKLQKLAQQTIRSQIQKRNTYFKDLLENQYERMEYASKKELKIMRQDKERIERELNSKYRDSGRRNFIENIKSQVL